jgi:hypothetical protein
MNRRSFLTGLIAAPAIVTFGNLMPIRALDLVEHYGIHPDMHRVLEAMRELNAWQAQWAEAAEFLLPSRKFLLTGYNVMERQD